MKLESPIVSTQWLADNINDPSLRLFDASVYLTVNPDGPGYLTESGRAKLVPADIIPPDERPDDAFPFVLITGRQLEHWHTGSMTRRSEVLHAVEPMPTVSMCSADLQALGVQAGDVVTVASRRGQVCLHVRLDEGTPVGVVFIPFAYQEAAANLLTNPALDPFGKIPELKYCAVSVTAGGELAHPAGFGVNA